MQQLTAEECPTRLKNVKITEVQQNRKIWRRQAKDLVEEKSSEISQVEEPKYEVYLQIEINQKDMKKMHV